MDSAAVLTGVVGAWFGWTLKGYYPDPVETAPSACNCNCFHQSAAETGTSWTHCGIIVALIVGLSGLLFNAALALKVTVTSRTDSSSREVAFSVKGKSKGIYSPPSALQIKG